MRINVYSQELTNEVILINKTSNTGIIYNGIQFIMHSSERLHHPPKDDDRSAVTFWLPRSTVNRNMLAGAFELAAAKVRSCNTATFLD